MIKARTVWRLVAAGCSCGKFMRLMLKRKCPCDKNLPTRWLGREVLILAKSAMRLINLLGCDHSKTKLSLKFYEPISAISRLSKQTSSPVETRKNDSTKSSSKTKKVASISFLGLLFFVLLFGGLVPLVDVKYGGLGIGFSSGKFGIVNSIRGERGVERKERGSQTSPGSNLFIVVGHGREPLVASFYVPKNDKLVKIDDNLIVHSDLACEKALAILERGNGGRHSNVYRNPAERQKTLECGDGDVDSTIILKSFSQIFIVVLKDNVKYVTYSCVVPQFGPHLVTT
ncbi:bZIP transcription factor 17-like [Mangifera indica]|uniref:bZIP transcription factor 17-like n=1 Tax=Mangifera indica TaxID=29780 RepID=UPI001CFB953B|nr:bZIP transcription factor 17-like [Mangifera indica]